MLIQKFGLELRSINSGDIETIRLWRNKDFVRCNMHYTQVISAEQQKEWFNKLDKQCNLYFIIVYQGKQIGLINLKDINWQTKKAEAGIFIGEEEYLNTITPILATIAMMDFAFGILKLENLKAKINKHNTEALKFNQSIGYAFKEEIDGLFTYFNCNKTLFLEATKSFRATIDKFNTSELEFKATTEEAERLGLNLISVKGLKVSIE